MKPIYIKNKAVFKKISEMEQKCVQKFGAGAFCFMGQLRTEKHHPGSVQVIVGIFDHKESAKLIKIICNRKNKIWEWEE